MVLNECRPLWSFWLRNRQNNGEQTVYIIGMRVDGLCVHSVWAKWSNTSRYQLGLSTFVLAWSRTRFTYRRPMSSEQSSPSLIPGRFLFFNYSCCGNFSLLRCYKDQIYGKLIIATLCCQNELDQIDSNVEQLEISSCAYSRNEEKVIFELLLPV